MDNFYIFERELVSGNSPHKGGLHANRDIFAATAALEIWEHTGGALDGFVCSAGTDATLASVAQGLKSR